MSCIRGINVVALNSYLLKLTIVLLFLDLPDDSEDDDDDDDDDDDVLT